MGKNKERKPAHAKAHSSLPAGLTLQNLLIGLFALLIPVLMPYMLKRSAFAKPEFKAGKPANAPKAARAAPTADARCAEGADDYLCPALHKAG